MLTRKQFELLRFIHERLTETGVPPSFDEMKDALDLRSKSGIHRLITALEERGFIRRLANRARAIEVIKLPDSVAHGMSGRRSRGFTPSVIEGDLGRVRAVCRGRRRSRQHAPDRGAGHGPHRRRHADRGDPDPQPCHQHAARPAVDRRAFRAGSARRFDDRGRHSRRRHRADPQARKPPTPATSWWR